MRTTHVISAALDSKLTFKAGRPILLAEEEAMKQSDHFRENAENCAQLAERATDDGTFKRYKRMESAWRALAEEQDWLDGEIPPSAKEPSR